MGLKLHMCWRKRLCCTCQVVLANIWPNTAESFVTEAVRDVVQSHGRSLTPEALQASTGRRPLEAWQAVKDVLDINCSAQQLFDESEPVLSERSQPAPSSNVLYELMHALADVYTSNTRSKHCPALL